jgi:hypothetical protein
MGRNGPEINLAHAWPGVQYLKEKNLKVAWAEFLTLSLTVFVSLRESS